MKDVDFDWSASSVPTPAQVRSRAEAWVDDDYIARLSLEGEECGGHLLTWTVEVDADWTTDEVSDVVLGQIDVSLRARPTWSVERAVNEQRRRLSR